MDNSFYLEKFAEQSFVSWKIKEDIVISPINHQINTKNIDYKLTSRESQSEIMWFYSLGWIAKLNIENNDKGLTISLLGDFLNLINSKDVDLVYLPNKNSSYDHCAASRIRYICMIAAKNESDAEINEILMRILNKDIEWFLALNKIEVNNHGMMLCVSIFHAFLFLKNDNAKHAVEKANTVLENILQELIPENGYVCENTIGYHEFYYKYFKKLKEFIDSYNEFDFLKKMIDQKYIKIENALFKVVMPNGNIPQIGQSGYYPTKYKSIPGKHIFSEQGFFIRKDDHNYFSYICGYKTNVHKQLDNTSISLNLGGEQIFLDCGLGTYDAKDTRATAINGQRGHTGAFYKKFDLVRRNTFMNSKDIKNIKSTLVESNDLIMSYYSFESNEKSYYISRVIELSDFFNFTILDNFKTNDSHAFPVSRFILPDYVKIKHELGFLQIEYENYIMTMRIDGVFNYSLKAASEDYLDDNFADCWQAKKFNEYEKCKMLEIYPTSNNTVKFLITIKQKI